MTSDPRDPSEYGGDTPPDVMDPGPQPVPDDADDADETPTPDDPSKDGAGGA